MQLKLFIFLVFFPTFNAFANELEVISKSRTWLKLLHINNGSATSEIENPEYFLTSFGEDFALRELKATIQSSSSLDSDASNSLSARCRYPARTLFLSQFNLVPAITVDECPEISEWIGSKNYDISIIYADGFLGNPASFYGHLLFKIDHKDDNPDLLSSSLNFGAGVDDSENKIVYVLKGLFGGYKAKYTSNYFYRHNINYTEVELRDLWKYTLELNDFEKRLVVYHAWELLQSEYTYYFTHRNCAYHVAKLIEVVTTEDLVSANHPFVLPITIFDNAMQTTTGSGRSLIRDFEYLPSRQTKLRQKFNALPNNLQAITRDIVQSAKVDVTQLSEHQQMRVLNVVLDYIEFALTQVDKESNEFITLKTLKRTVQQARIILPPDKDVDVISSPRFKPHQGHKPSLLRTSLGQYSKRNFIDLTLRPAFYDLNSSGGGILENSALSMLEIAVRMEKDKSRLSKVDLINIETYQTGGTGLNHDKDNPWKIRVGYERDYLDGLENTGEWFVEGAMGKALKWNQNVIIFANIDVKLQTPDNANNRLFLQPNIGFIASNDWANLNCKLAYRKSIKNMDQAKSYVNCSASLWQNKSWDIRLKAKRYRENEISVAASWYW